MKQTKVVETKQEEKIAKQTSDDLGDSRSWQIAEPAPEDRRESGRRQIAEPSPEDRGETVRCEVAEPAPEGCDATRSRRSQRRGRLRNASNGHGFVGT